MFIMYKSSILNNIIVFKIINTILSSSSLKFNVTRSESTKEHTPFSRHWGTHPILFTALRQCWTILRRQTTSGYTAVLFIYIGRMLFLAPTLDTADLDQIFNYSKIYNTKETYCYYLVIVIKDYLAKFMH